MNKTLHLLFNHTLTPEQIKDAQESLGVSEIEVLPNHLKQLWSNVPPTKELNLKNHLQPIVAYFKEVQPKDYVLVQGDFGAVFYMVNQLEKMGFTPLYATTERKVIEEQNKQNEIISKRIFKHVCYRKYKHP